MNSQEILRRVLPNIGWSFYDRLLRVAVSFLVTVWLARYLGPVQFGLLSFAVAFVALPEAIASLGFQNIAVKALVASPQRRHEILGSIAATQFLGGVIAYALVSLAIGWLRPDDPVGRVLVWIIGATLLFKCVEPARYWFESQIQARYAVWAGTAAVLAGAAARLVAIVQESPLVVFAWIALAEAAFAAAALLAVYAWKQADLKEWRARRQRAMELLARSWPLALSGLAVMVYMRIDQIMLGQMVGDGAVGVYSAAVRISEAWYFVPVAISASMFPLMVSARQEGESLFRRRTQGVFEAVLLVSVPFIALLTLFASPIVLLIFGSQFAGSADVLTIHAWTGVFVSLGLVSNKWQTAQDLQRQVLVQTLLGATANVAMNAALIPSLGVLGAAVATLVSYALSVFSIALFPRGQQCLSLMMSSLRFGELRRHLFSS